ncbi:MAG: NAD-dependent succinate-semialdehyde dehydrogenase, partial [Planctomycetota bacterium]
MTRDEPEHTISLPEATTALVREGCFVGGSWIEPEHGRRFRVQDPATGETIAACADATAKTAELAVHAAADAMPAWAALTARRRAEVLLAWYDLLTEHREALAALMTAEQGKPLAESLAEVDYGASFVRWFAEEAPRIAGEILASPSDGRRLLTLRQPVGVVSAITPWNFPVAMITRKVAPALAAGCAAVVKPAEDTPLCALALAELAQQAGVPDGVLNVVTSSEPAEVGRVLATHPLVRKLTFTGSTRVGTHLLELAAGTVKRTSMELGGNAPLIVFDDADLDRAVNGAIASRFRNGGQTCICTNRLLVHDSVQDAFVSRFVECVRALRVGPGTEPGVDIGPMISKSAADRLTELHAETVAAGATELLDRPAFEGPGSFVAPSVLVDAEPSMRIFREEIFGPIAVVYRFADEAAAVRLANETDAGLASYIYTADAARQWRVAEALEYGMVGVNEVAITGDAVPFGGIKQSGLGREGSTHGID